MNEQEKFDKSFRKYPHPVASFSARPHLSRRQLLRIWPARASRRRGWRRNCRPAPVITSTPVTMHEQGEERDLHPAGGRAQPYRHVRSESDPGHDARPRSIPTPSTASLFPTGLMPKLAAHDGRISPSSAPCRPGRWCIRWRRPGRRSGAIRPACWATFRPISAAWWRSRRTRAHRQSGLPDVPRAQLAGARRPRLFPGVLRAVQGDARRTPGSRTPPIPTARPASMHRWDFLHHLDDPLRVNSPDGTPMDDYNQFYTAAKGMMYNPIVTNGVQVFRRPIPRLTATLRSAMPACWPSRFSLRIRAPAISRSPSAAGTCT